jgi:hypothetical protein
MLVGLSPLETLFNSLWEIHIKEKNCSEGEYGSRAWDYISEVLLPIGFARDEVDSAIGFASDCLRGARSFWGNQRPLEPVLEKYCEKLLAGPIELRDALRSESSRKGFILRICMEAAQP